LLRGIEDLVFDNNFINGNLAVIPNIGFCPLNFQPPIQSDSFRQGRRIQSYWLPESQMHLVPDSVANGVSKISRCVDADVDYPLGEDGCRDQVKDHRRPKAQTIEG